MGTVLYPKITQLVYRTLTENIRTAIKIQFLIHNQL